MIYHRQALDHLHRSSLPTGPLSNNERDQIADWLERYLGRLRAATRQDISLGLGALGLAGGSSLTLALVGDMALTWGSVTFLTLMIGSARAYNVRRALKLISRVEERIEDLIQGL